MNDLLTFKRNAMMLGLCTAYKDKWNKADNKAALMDMALDSNGVEMLSDAAAFGWSMDIQYMKRTFSDHINGKWKRTKDGYSSCLYVDYNGKIEQECTLTTVLASKVEFHVPKGNVCKLYIAGGSEVNITGDGKCYVYSYGENKVKGNFNQMVCITKSEWAK
jgi:hypothetical protein